MIDGRGRTARLSTTELSAAEPAGVAMSQPPVPPEREPGRRRGFGRRQLLLVVLAVLVVAATIAALVVTNIRISGRPALSINKVNTIVNQKVSTAISQLISAAGRSHRLPGRPGRARSRRSEAGPAYRGSRHGGHHRHQGDILTALHVVQGASVIKVTFADGTTSRAPSRRPTPPTTSRC